MTKQDTMPALNQMWHKAHDASNALDELYGMNFEQGMRAVEDKAARRVQRLHNSIDVRLQQAREILEGIERDIHAIAYDD